MLPSPGGNWGGGAPQLPNRPRPAVPRMPPPRNLPPGEAARHVVAVHGGGGGACCSAAKRASCLGGWRDSQQGGVAVATSRVSVCAGHVVLASMPLVWSGAKRPGGLATRFRPLTPARRRRQQGNNSRAVSQLLLLWRPEVSVSQDGGGRPPSFSAGQGGQVCGCGDPASRGSSRGVDWLYGGVERWRPISWPRDPSSTAADSGGQVAEHLAASSKPLPRETGGGRFGGQQNKVVGSTGKVPGGQLSPSERQSDQRA